MHGDDRDLGMDRQTSRRDFLNGVAVAVTGSLVGPTWLEAAGVAPDVQAPEAVRRSLGDRHRRDDAA